MIDYLWSCVSCVVNVLSFCVLPWFVSSCAPRRNRCLLPYLDSYAPCNFYIRLNTSKQPKSGLFREKFLEKIHTILLIICTDACRCNNVLSTSGYRAASLRQKILYYSASR